MALLRKGCVRYNVAVVQPRTSLKLQRGFVMRPPEFVGYITKAPHGHLSCQLRLPPQTLEYTDSIEQFDSTHSRVSCAAPL